MNSAGVRRIAVIGGGLSGLAAAHRLIELASQVGAAPVSVSLFEAGDRLGGVIGTERIGDYLVERGADSFITNKPGGVSLCRRLGLEDRLIPTDPACRRSLVLSRGKPVPVPEGFLLVAPAKIWPVLTTSILSPAGKARLAMEYFVSKRTDDADESLAAFVRRRFGSEVFERIVQPLVGGIYTADPEKLSLRATMPRFIEWEQKYGSLIRGAQAEQQRRDASSSGSADSTSGARYGLFTTLAGGMSELFDALVKRIERSADVRLSTPVTGIAGAHGTSGFELSFRNSAPEQFDAIVLAVPAYLAAQLMQGLDTALASELNEIEYASSAVIVSGHALADIRHPLDAAGLVIPAIERRKILAVSFASRKFPGRAPDGRVILRTFVGGATQSEILEHSDSELTAIVRSELEQILGVSGREDFSIVARYNRAMPQYHVGHVERVGRIEQLCAAHPGLSLAGSYLHGVGIPDCIQSGEAAAERIVATVPPAVC